MKIYGFDMADGSTLTNLVVASGNEFPPGTEGELFYRNDGANEGMYVYDGEEWVQLGASAAPAGALLSELTGDVTGTVEGGTTSAVYLAAVGTSGTFVVVTVDEKGRVISGTSTQAWSSITSTPTSLSGYGITDAQPLDADLTSIAGLTGTGVLKKTATDTWSLDTSTFLTTNQTITLSGDASGSGSTSIEVTISSSTVTGKYLNGYQDYINVPIGVNDTILSALGRLQGQVNARITGNQFITLSGDVSGGGTTSISVILANSGVAAGTYTKVTVDAKGRVTTATTLTAGDIPSLSATYQLLDADLTAIAALSGTAGILKKTGANTWELDTASYATGNELITVSGDATGSGTTSISLTLSNSGVAAGTYGSASSVAAVTVDSKGRITTSSNTSIAISASQVTSGTFGNDRFTSSNITQFQSSLTIDETQITDGAWLARVGSSETISGVWSFNNPVTVATPTAGGHAVTKDYVDNTITGLDMKASVRVATTANITLSGTQTIDGVAVIAGDRVLVKDQNTASENGIYVVAASTWARAADADNTPSGEVTSGMYTFVEEGTVNANSGWVLSTNNPITLASTNLTFVQFNGLGQISAGSGLTKSGNTINVVSASADRVVINADSVDLATTGTAGTYSKVTTDAYGRVISGSSLSTDDIPSLAGTYVLKAGDTLTGTLTGTNFYAGNGTVSAPSISFSADSNTGIYRPSEDAIAFVEGGTEVMRITSSSYVGIGIAAPVAKFQVDLGAEGEYMRVGGDNAAGGRALRFSSTQSGVSPGAFHTINAASGEGQIAFATASVERMRIDSVGRVGIGTSTFTHRLAVYGGDINLMANATYIRSATTAGTSTRMLGINASDVAYVGPIDTGPVAAFYNVAPSSVVSSFYTAGSERMRIDSSGNVGIGTVAPASKLHVSGQVSATSFLAASAGSFDLRNAWTTSSGVLSLRNGTDFGKGNEFHLGYFPSPNDGSEAWLMLYGSSSATMHMALTDGNLVVGTTVHSGNRLTVSGTATFTSMRIANGTTSSPSLSFNDDFTTGIYKPTTATLGFSTNGSERMRIDSSGNVGIGTTSPQQALHISRAGSAYSLLENTAASLQLLFGSTSGSGNAIYSRTTASGPSPLLFFSGADNVVTISANGVLGVGVTPSAWGNAYDVVELSGGSFYSSSPTYVAMMQNIYNNGTSTLYKATAAASLSDQTDGAFRWFTAPSGTAGTTATLTERMRLDVSGNLGLGVAPSAWSTGKAFEVGAAGNGLWGYPNTTYLTQGAYYNGGWKYAINSTAVNAFGAQNGAFTWFTAPAGTASNAISFTQAMTLDANNQLLLGGTSAAPIKEFSAGSVGLTIQSAVPTIAFVDDEDTTNDRSWIANAAGDMYISNKNTSGKIIIQNAGAERMRIDSSGNVGIGVAPGGYNTGGCIQIQSGKFIHDDSFARFWLRPGYQIGSATYAGLYGPALTYLVQHNGTSWLSTGGGNASALTVDEGIFSFANSSSGFTASGQTVTWATRMVIGQTGNVGIGTSSPFGVGGGVGLHINETNNPAIRLTNTATGVSSTDGSAIFVGNAASAGTTSLNIYNYEAAPITFFTNATERMRITSDGNVGLGTTAPEVIANYKTLETSGTTGGLFQATNGTQKVALYVNASNGYAGTRSNHPFLFVTNAAERMRIDTSGNIGLGVTPNAWGNSGSTGKAIEFAKGSVASLAGGPNDHIAVASNSYASSGTDPATAVWTYAATGSATLYEGGRGGTHRWFNAPSGTAGTTATFTERMVLNSSGNLGLGVTPSAWGTNYKSLQINSGGASVNGWNGDARLNLASNVYWENAAAKYISTAGASYEQINAGAFYWFNAPSGTAGTTATFTQAMLLDASSNLVLTGTTGAATHNLQLVSSNTVAQMRFVWNNAASTYAGMGSDASGNIILGRVANLAGTSTVNAQLTLDTSGTMQLSAGPVVQYTPAPAALSSTATLTNANIQAQIISATGAAPYTLTMPLGSTLESLASWTAVNLGYDFYVINTASGTVTMATNTNVTSLGALGVTAGTSAHFRIRRTAANTFVLYRLS